MASEGQFVRAHVFVSGRVQGVNYRWYTQRKAQELELTGWVRNLWDAMEPYSSGGVYVNYLGQETDEGADRIKEAYGPEKYERLVALKNKYDPTNLFRMNQNIKPTEG